MTTPHSPHAETDVVEPPARQIARSSREIIERVMLQLSRLPAKVDRGPVVAAMGGALSALRTLSGSEIDDPDHVELLRAAVTATSRAHGEMSKAEASADTGLTKSLAGVCDALSNQVEPTVSLVIKRQEKLLRRAPEAPPKKPALPVFSTSDGVARLFAFERAELLPLVNVAPSAQAVRDEEAKDAEVSDKLEEPPEGASLEASMPDKEGVTEPIDEAISLESEIWRPEEEAVFSAEDAEQKALRSLCRDTAEELGSLGLLRAPVGTFTPWDIGPSAFEERLLAHLDAFMSLAEPFVSGSTEKRFDVLPPLIEWAGDAMVPDPARAFARAFILGCIAGDDTASAAVTQLRQSHSITYEAQRDALSLAPHPKIVPLVSRMLTEESPELLRVGLGILERRRQAAFEIVAPLLSHPVAAVRCGAARCLRVASATQTARHLLAQHSDTEEDEDALAATAESLVVLGARKGLDIARRQLAEEAKFPGALSQGARVSFLRLLAIAGGPTDGDLLLASLGHDPVAASCLGYFGDATLIPAMLGVLTESADVAARAIFCAALTRSLHRITGLGRPPNGDPKQSIYLVDPPLSPSFWTAAWEEKRENFATKKKYRFGSAFTPILTALEAETPELPASRRGDLLFELAITTKGASRADASDWTARQKLALAEMRERVKRGGDLAYPEGQWPRAVLFE